MAFFKASAFLYLKDSIVWPRDIADDPASLTFEAIETIIWKLSIAPVVRIVSKSRSRLRSRLRSFCQAPHLRFHKKWISAIQSPYANSREILGTLPLSVLDTCRNYLRRCPLILPSTITCGSRLAVIPRRLVAFVHEGTYPKISFLVNYF